MVWSSSSKEKQKRKNLKEEATAAMNSFSGGWHKTKKIWKNLKEPMLQKIEEKQALDLSEILSNQICCLGYIAEQVKLF